MNDPAQSNPISLAQRVTKRSIDIVVGLIGLIISAPIIALAFLIASVETRTCGLFVQERVGRLGRCFRLIKIRTMRPGSEDVGSWTAANDPRITRTGAFMRRYKIDELPQFVNVLMGHMSLVGPRPDVPGFADKLSGEDRLILSVRPGITGPATLSYRHEEDLLERAVGLEEYNMNILFPEKVRMNLEYVHTYSLRRDFVILLRTARSLLIPRH